ncbi:MAG: response regulator [Thermomicrobia bacterium]|nr:response regulator [Thermomicrobia bacterium]
MQWRRRWGCGWEPQRTLIDLSSIYWKERIIAADLLRDLLEDEGHTVLAARNGREALALARAEHPDLVLSDVMMPLMNGVQLARMLRDELLAWELVVILMSAAHPPDLASAGAAAFLAKPFDLDEVSRLVARHIAR